ncbi:hypothetical protein Cgig2_005369 [Carnegiea gigantea]|uniref:TPD1 protein homolog 1-like n=1 Tax=Carnegiea gigantea TaxID=171969 RepID=A0A9Q1K6E9_9CARY|nr:hypothetical protein Cgig2_005369 [Carnegiea gigantea]
MSPAPLLKLCMLCSLFFHSISAHLGLALAFASASATKEASRKAGIEREVMISKANAVNPPNNSPLSTHKLLPSTPIFVNRAGEEESCSRDDIEIEQGPLATLPSGIPTYSVQILNVCVSGCTISNIHVSCGWFSSATLVDPNIFKRVSYDDCLVNAGEPLAAGQSLTFQYANTHSYPLSVSSVAC